MLTVFCSQAVFAADSETGICGGEISWNYDGDGKLTIQGSGAMYDYSEQEGEMPPWAAYFDDITTVTISSGITHIGNYSFYRCRALTDISYGDDLESIGDSAFERCILLTEISLPKHVKEIGDKAFYGCRAAKSVTLDKAVQRIGSKAFAACTNLAKITLKCTAPSPVTDAFEGFAGTIYYPMDDNLWDQATRNAWCSGANWVGSRTPSGGDEDSPKSGKCGSDLYWEINGFGCLNISGSGEMDDYSATSEKQAPWAKSSKTIKSIYIEEGMTHIGNYAFLDCTLVDSVTIANSVIDIGRGAFKNCSALSKVDLPEGLESIDLYAFQNCSALEYFQTPAKVTEWSRYMLSGCSSLKRAVVSQNVKVLGDNLFKDCSSLEVILLKCTAPNKATSAFTNYKGKIYYPSGSKGWTDSARLAWAPNGEWIDRSKVTFDGSAYTKLNADRTAAETELAADMFDDILKQMEELEPEEVAISLKPAGDLSKVTKAEIKCPVNIAKASMDLSSKLTVEFADGSFTLDPESLKGAIKSDSEYIIIRLTDLSNYEVSIETYYNVTMKVVSDTEERLITEVDGFAETTIPVMYKADATLFAYADHDGSRYDASSYMLRDGLAVIGSSYVGDGGTQGKDWKNARMTLSKKTFTYSGSRQDPGVKVFINLTNGQSFTLKKGLHYSLNESNWIKVGDRSVKASPLKNSDVANLQSKGSLTDKIRINPGVTSVSITTGAKKITVKMGTAVSKTGASYYKVYYRKYGATSWKACSGTSNQSKTITGLSVNKRYQVCVRAYTGSYNGKLSSVKTSGYVKPSKINSPSLKRISLTSSRATVTMGSPSSYFSGISYSAQYYKAGTGSWGKVQGFKQHSRTKISFTDGKAGKKYNIRVRVSGYFHGKKYTSSYKYFSYTAR